MVRFFLVLLFLVGAARVFLAQEAAPRYKSDLPADDPAIQYGRAGDDPAARLASDLAAGRASLGTGTDPLATLRALLDRLHIGADAQMLVFSQTSFQARRISPSHPRAIYFGDAAMVGYVPGAPTIEIAALDPVRGPVFYTMTLERPAIVRSSACLRCHQGPNTAGVPGIFVGSVIPGPTGAPLGDESAVITDHRTPFAERWGGWYVTARRGETADRANAVASSPADRTTLVRDAGRNLATLAGRFDRSQYLASTSDIVALMTFEHQTQMTNLITRVGWEARIVARRLQPSESVSPAMLDADVEDLVEYMLFAGEAPIELPIEGVSSFTRTFAERGPRDRRSRSLRDFDLKTRLFRYPLSYMIYSASFDALPGGVRDRIYRRLFDVLSGKDRSPGFAYLSSEDRRAIVEILSDTKPGLPAYWSVLP